MDPMALLHTIREAQSVPAAIVSPELIPTPRGEGLERFWPGYPTGGVRSKSKPKANRE